MAPTLCSALSTLNVGFVLFAFFSAQSAHGSDVGTAVTETTGGFSYSAPKDWVSTEFKGERFKIAHSAPANGFAPNLVLTQNAHNGTIGDYVKTNMRGVSQNSKNFKATAASALLTAAGEPCVRVAGESDVDGRRLRFIWFFFAGKGDSRAMMTFTMLASDGAKHDDSIDASARTFRFVD